MLILITMAVGILIGLVFPKKWQKYNSWVQVVCIGLLVFVMGLKLGSRPNLGTELMEVGWKSILLGVIPTALSIVAVYPLSRRFLRNKRHER